MVCPAFSFTFGARSATKIGVGGEWQNRGNMFIYSYGTFRFAKRYVHILFAYSVVTNDPSYLGLGGLVSSFTHFSLHVNI